MKTDYLIVGAGYAGSVCARELADAGKTVVLIDKRPHIGGNAYDERDAHGVLIHPYGPHIFHTNSKKVFEYLSRFTTWRFYEHRVLAQVAEQLLRILELMLTRRPVSPDTNRRRNMESLVAAHERLWHLRHAESPGL